MISIKGNICYTFRHDEGSPRPIFVGVLVLLQDRAAEIQVGSKFCVVHWSSTPWAANFLSFSSLSFFEQLVFFGR